MIISNAVVCDVHGERQIDVRIDEGAVTEIGHNLSGDERIDANGTYLLPGLVDTNVRLMDAQLNGKNIDQLALEALRGGVTTVVLAPDSSPQVDDTIVLEFVQQHRSHWNGATIETMVAATNEKELLSDIAILLKRGAAAPYMTTAISNNLACRIAEYVKMYDRALFCKAQDTSLSEVGVMVEGEIATRMGLVGIPPLGETVHVARMIEIARNFGVKIVFKSIAAPRSIEMISHAKKEGIAVECEVSLHHLLLSDESCEGFNTTAKLDPPLAIHDDMLLLQKALQSGEIDMLSVLHQPNSPVNKEVAFADAFYGCEAIADTMPLYYTKLVKSGLITLSQLLEFTSKNTMASLGKEAGVIEVGSEAQFILFDAQISSTITNTQSLYHNETITGKVMMVFKDSQVIEL